MSQARSGCGVLCTGYPTGFQVTPGELWSFTMRFRCLRSLRIAVLPTSFFFFPRRLLGFLSAMWLYLLILVVHVLIFHGVLLCLGLRMNRPQIPGAEYILTGLIA